MTSAGVLLLAGLLVPSPAPEPPQEPARPASDRLVGPVTIEVVEVFDQAVAAERGLVADLANALHVRTREVVVRREILFRTGEPFDEERLRQTERNLRALGIFRKVEVRALPERDGAVPVHVRAVDGWTLGFGWGYERQGGVNTFDLRVAERNLAGRGVTVGARYLSGFERDECSASIGTGRLFGTREQATATYAARSDGVLREFGVARPFFTIDTPWGHDTLFRSSLSRYHVYEDGQSVWEYDLRAADAIAGVALKAATPSPRSAWRVGFGYRFTAREYAMLPAADPAALATMPTSVRWGGPYAAVQYLEHRFETRNDLIGPERDVDFNVGLSLSASVTFSTPGTGPRTGTRVLGDVAVSRGGRIAGRGLALAGVRLGSEFGGTLESRGAVTGNLRVWWPRSQTRVRALLVEGRALVNPDRGVRYYLGGSPGLRGFPEYFFAGTRTLLVVVEERKYSGWRPLGLVQPGVAFFAEGGAVGGLESTTGTGSIHGDIGAGLRLAILKSSGSNIIKVDLAVPLGPARGDVRGVQLVVGYRSDF